MHADRSALTAGRRDGFENGNREEKVLTSSPSFPALPCFFALMMRQAKQHTSPVQPYCTTGIIHFNRFIRF
jgi:hypothetical protein